MPQPGSSELIRKAQVQGANGGGPLVRPASAPLRTRRGTMHKQVYRVRHKKAPAATAAETGTLLESRMGAPRARVLTLAKKARAATARPGLPDAPGNMSPLAQRTKRPPVVEIFLGSVEAARAQARLIINEPRPEGYTRIVEGWQQ